jgi:glycosyltransferase involved in cell wall biosynthesis
MKILQVHNVYQHRGGEDSVVEAEAALLRAKGHEVISFVRDNSDITGMAAWRAAADTLWSRRTHAEIRALVHDERPDLMHAHNTFPLISPSAFWAAQGAALPVVQTLHNFRLICPQAMLLREGKVCEDCIGRAPLPAVIHACYRGSRAATSVLSSMLVMHRAIGTWSHKVDRYIALNEFCRDKFVKGGLPADRIAVKPNFVSDGVSDVVDKSVQGPAPRQGLLFVGRLSTEKGLSVLARAAAALPARSLKVVGSGPDGAALAANGSVQMLGFMPPAAVRAAMRKAVALVFPSIWYETFGLVLVEAFAEGTPVIASRLGVVPDLVIDGQTGLLVQPGDSDELANKLRWALAHPEDMAAMGRRARQLYESRYTPEANYQQLLTIYAEAIASHRVSSAGRSSGT